MNIKLFACAALTLCVIPGCWSRKQHTKIIQEEIRGSGPEHWGNDVLEELEETDPIK